MENHESEKSFSKGTGDMLQEKAKDMAKDKLKETVMESEMAKEAKEKAKSGLWALVKSIFGL